MARLKTAAIMALVITATVWAVVFMAVLVSSFVAWDWVFAPMWPEIIRFTIVLGAFGALLGALIGIDEINERSEEEDRG